MISLTSFSLSSVFLGDVKPNSFWASLLWKYVAWVGDVEADDGAGDNNVEDDAGDNSAEDDIAGDDIAGDNDPGDNDPGDDDAGGGGASMMKWYHSVSDRGGISPGLVTRKQVIFWDLLLPPLSHFSISL